MLNKNNSKKQTTGLANSYKAWFVVSLLAFGAAVSLLAPVPQTQSVLADSEADNDQFDIGEILLAEPSFDQNNGLQQIDLTSFEEPKNKEQKVADKETKQDKIKTTQPPQSAPGRQSAPTTTASASRQTGKSEPAVKPQPKPQPNPGLETVSSLQFMNSLRAEKNKSALAQDSIMNSWALAHARSLARQCDLNHQNLSSFLGKNIGPITVQSIAENVGYASTTNQVLTNLKNSPGHYKNMVGDYNYVGIGVVEADSAGCKGSVFTTQIFAR